MALIGDDLGKDLESRRWHKAWDNADRHCLAHAWSQLAHTSMGAWVAVVHGRIERQRCWATKARLAPRRGHCGTVGFGGVRDASKGLRWAYMDTRGSSGHNARML